MFLSLIWIQDFVDLSGLDLEKLIHQFSLSTAEVENEIFFKGSDLSGVVVAEIKSIEDHPDSKKLHLLKVDIGADELVDVVCGAPNVRLGMKTAFAKVGAKLGELEITPRALAGYTSYGMCCSEKEIGISDDNSGIMDIADDVALGTDIKDLYQIGKEKNTQNPIYAKQQEKKEESCIDFSPYAILLGKPLVSLGDVAENERILRPEVFPTSLDVMKYNEGELSERAQRRLNERIWKKAKNVRWNKTKFIISYMIEDDYDDKGYETLISRLDTKQVKIYGKGIHGRHNDNSDAIVSWFLSQYERILEEDFGRKACE